MTAPSKPLAGRVAIVTGAARGIGLAALRRLVADGASVLAFDRHGADFSDALAAATDVERVVSHGGDVSREDDWTNAVAAAIALTGKIDILFNNAGISGGFETMLDYPPEVFDEVMAVNVRGVFLGMQQVGRVMRDRGSGVIVNVSSVSGFGGGAGGSIFAYVASKFAVNGMTKAAAMTLARSGVRVLAICPCPTETEMMFQVERKYSPDDPAAARPGLSQGIPMGRYGKPEEIADVLAFLVSDQAAFMTGALVPVDGGVLAR